MWNRQQMSFPVFQAVEQVIAEEHAKGRLPLPDFSRALELYSASDYSGEHKPARYQIISCIITSKQSWIAWEAYRQFARHVRQVKDRKIRYSDLRDPAQERMVMPLLSAALSLNGVLCCLAVDKSLRSLFDASGKIDINDPQLAPWRHWKTRQFERMLRVANVVSILFAGLSRPRQSLLWVTDEDEIASNPAQLRALAMGLAGMISGRVPHEIGSVECVTTITDSGAFETEDFTAIPDLVGGAVADLLTSWKNAGVSWSTKLILPMPESVPVKARPIIEWFFHAHGTLTRLLILVIPGTKATDIQVKLFPLQ